MRRQDDGPPDAAFHRVAIVEVLRPSGVYIMTTHDGDAMPALRGPDRKWHHCRHKLAALPPRLTLAAYPSYPVAGERARSLGPRPASVRHPLRSVQTLLTNVVNGTSLPGARRARTMRTRHLVAVARRSA